MILRQRPTDLGTQRGIALLVALALLTALTVATLAVAHTTTLELAMARNDEDALRALHAADAALTEAEAWLRANGADPTSLVAAAGGVGLFATPVYGVNGPSALDVRTVGQAATIRRGSPRRRATSSSGWAAASIPAPRRNRYPPAQVDWYRITARGVGRSFAVAVAQSTWGQTRDGRTERALTGRLSWTRLGE